MSTSTGLHSDPRTPPTWSLRLTRISSGARSSLWQTSGLERRGILSEHQLDILQRAKRWFVDSTARRVTPFLRPNGKKEPTDLDLIIRLTRISSGARTSLWQTSGLERKGILSEHKLDILQRAKRGFVDGRIVQAKWTTDVHSCLCVQGRQVDAISIAVCPDVQKTKRGLC
ncbi:uncharacterized protein LOC111106345 isoform X1 [Crassostrea virginica]